MKNSVDVDASHDCNQHAQQSNACVGEHGRVEQAADFFEIARRRVFRNVADDRRANAEIENAVVTGEGKNQYPDAECRVSQAMQNEGREKHADQNVDSKREPA